MQQLGRSWKGMMAAGLLAWTAACGGAPQDASGGNGQDAAQSSRSSVPGAPPAGYEGSAMQKQALAAAATNALTPNVTHTGFISLSLDGVGTNGASGTVQVQKPAGATVKAAYLAAASTGFSNYQIPNGGVKIDGVSVNWNQSIPSSISSYNHWADVTALVSNKINSAPAGRVNFTVTESNTYSVDGEILAVVFNNPAATTVNTVVLMFGAQSTGGDTFRIALAEPINKADPNLGLDLSLGISFGYQESVASERQVSIIDVNGQRLTSQAGGQDDGASEDGALITVGGLDDTNANPPPNSGGPGFRGDDELYDLRPFVNNGATQISVVTRNPSNDDNVFFGALSLTSAAAIVGEGIVLGPTTSSGNAGTTHTLTATLQDNGGNALVNRTVTFKVKSGPNAGITGTAVTNSTGKATFTYTGGPNAGRDTISASFVKVNGEVATSNDAFRDWIAPNRPPIASCGNIVLETGGDICGASGSINNGSSDPDGDAINCVQSPAGPFGPGTTVVTLTCTDTKEASSSCTGTVQVVDHAGPSISCPANQTAECVNGGAAVNLGQAAASDNCGPVDVSSNAQASYPLGVNTVTYTATDSSFNSTSCNTLVTVQDTKAPLVTIGSESMLVVECGRPYAEPGATASDVCEGNLPVTASGSVLTGSPGMYVVTYSAHDSSGNTGSTTRNVLVNDTQAPVITLVGESNLTIACNAQYAEPGYSALDACQGDLTSHVAVSGSVNSSQSGTYTLEYSVADAYGNSAIATRTVNVGPCQQQCVPVNLSDYNLFLAGDYNGGHDVVGKVAAGGNINLSDFAVGSGLAASDTANVLVSGGNLSLNRGAVYGDARYGGSYSTNVSVTYPRGSAAQGSPIDFAARFAELNQRSSELGALQPNGTKTRYNWGGIYLKGTDPQFNVVNVPASDFNGAALLDINAPAGSLMVVNIIGTSASFGGFGTQFSGGVNQKGVLYNFVNATSITASGFGFWGTILAPKADITFTNGSWDGGLYAKSLTGNAEGHINALNDHSICPPVTPEG